MSMYHEALHAIEMGEVPFILNHPRHGLMVFASSDALEGDQEIGPLSHNDQTRMLWSVAFAFECGRRFESGNVSC